MKRRIYHPKFGSATLPESTPYVFRDEIFLAAQRAHLNFKEVTAILYKIAQELPNEIDAAIELKKTLDERNKKMGRFRFE